MIKVALTGNIGSGKSTVARIFNIFGIPVFNADIEARSLYYKEEVKDRLIAEFSDTLLTSAGEIDTKVLASIIFNDKKALQTVNAIIHPMIFDEYKSWCNIRANEHYTIHEAAIIFENNLQDNFDFVINVSAPLDVRLKRVMKRDGVSEELVRIRMANQLSDEIKCELSHFIIYNDGDRFLIPQVNTIHDTLLSYTSL